MLEAGRDFQSELAVLRLQLSVTSVTRLDAFVKSHQALGQLEEALQTPFTVPDSTWQSPPQRNFPYASRPIHEKNIGCESCCWRSSVRWHGSFGSNPGIEEARRKSIPPKSRCMSRRSSGRRCTDMLRPTELLRRPRQQAISRRQVRVWRLPWPGFLPPHIAWKGSELRKGRLCSSSTHEASMSRWSLRARLWSANASWLRWTGLPSGAVQDAEQLSRHSPNAAGIVAGGGAHSGHSYEGKCESGGGGDLTPCLAELVDMDRLVVSANVAGRTGPQCEPGRSARPSRRNPPTPSGLKLSSLTQNLDPTNGTVLLRAAIPPGSGLRPGPFVTLRIITGEHQDCLAVPVECVVRDAEEGDVVSVVEGNQAIRKRLNWVCVRGNWLKLFPRNSNRHVWWSPKAPIHLPQRLKVQWSRTQP
jgi:hypothetical protein